jgi:8-oxo-dGTP diphosphatase
MRSAYARCKIVTNQSEFAGGPPVREQENAVIGRDLAAITVVVDVANVMGARADGWWRDRAAAALRLCEQVIALAGRGVPAELMPGGLPAPKGWVLVLEGRAKDAATDVAAAAGAAGGVRVVAAPGSGDDAIVGEVVSLGGACLVVTADRELRRRCEAAGAAVAGPGWLLGLL